MKIIETHGLSIGIAAVGCYGFVEVGTAASGLL
jgi:hypothetical protein